MSEELNLSPRIIVATNGAPKAIGPYSQAVRAGNLLFTSGQVALHPETQQVVGTEIKEQATQVFANLKAILEAGGSGFARSPCRQRFFLKNFDDFTAMNAIYAEHLGAGGTQPPARTTVEVSRLPKDVLVEIDLVALISND